MNIVIIGAGAVGSSICAELVDEGHNITIVDSNTEALAEISSTCDVIPVEGTGIGIDTLEKASMDKADLVIAVTSNDEINILACSAAKRLGAIHTIARVRNPEYTEFIKLMQSEMNLSFTINPELAVARDIYRILKFPSAIKIDTFLSGKVELAELILQKGSMLVGKSLNELRAQFAYPFLICAVQRNKETYIPKGSFVLEEGDTISITIPEESIESFFRAIGEYKKPIKNVLIFGGGRTTYYLEELLEKGKIKSTVIEKHPGHSVQLAETFPNCTVVCDDGVKQERLLEEGIETADAFLALTDVDGENVVTSLYAKSQGVKKIITMVSSIPYIDFFHQVGIDSIVSAKTATANIILRYVRSLQHAGKAEIESLHKIMNGTVEATEFTVKTEYAGLTGIPLRELKLKEDVLLVSIQHGDKVFLPTGSDSISVGDHIILVSTEDIQNLKEIIR